VFTDPGVSGGAALDKRPGLLAALAALRTHNAGLLLVAKRDRLARDSLLAALVERLAERLGARVQSADGAADGDAPEDVLMRRIGARLCAVGLSPRSGGLWHPQTIASIAAAGRRRTLGQRPQ
jgi:hypothetical protein